MPASRATAKGPTFRCSRVELAQADPAQVPARTQRLARRRSLAVLALFTLAMVVAVGAPVFGVELICLALLLHVRPDGPVFAPGWPGPSRGRGVQ